MAKNNIFEEQFRAERGREPVGLMGNYAMGYVWWLESRLKKQKEIENELVGIICCDVPTTYQGE